MASTVHLATVCSWIRIGVKTEFVIWLVGDFFSEHGNLCPRAVHVHHTMYGAHLGATVRA